MGKAPKAPDPYATANAQAGANFTTAQQNAIMGNVNEYTPYGSKTYQQIGWDPVYDSSGKMSYAPRYQSTVQLSDDQQRLLGQQTGLQYNLGNIGLQQSSRLYNHLGTELNTSGLQGWNAGPSAPRLATSFKDVGGPQRSIAGGGGIQKSVGSGGEIRQDQGATDRAAIEKAMMGRYNSDASRSNAAQNAQLAAQGLSPGSQGYGTIQEQQGRNRTDALQQAYLASGQESRAAQDAYNQAQNQRFGQGVQQGAFANAAQLQQFQQNAAQGQFANEAQQQAFAQAAQRAGFSNDAITQMFQMGGMSADRQNALRQNQLTERIALRNQPINEIMALMGASGPSTPQFQPFQSSSMQAPNIGQMIYDNYNARSQQASNSMSGLFGIGSSIAGALPWASMFASDRRLKQDIEPVGRQLAGLPLYAFRYKADPRLPQIGVMADEARLIHPDAVLEIDGYDHVDYGLLNRRHDHG
jgi:hypothetical protein